MKKVDLVANEFALMCVCECIGNDNDKLDKIIDKENNGYDIEFKINGEELDFLEVIKFLRYNYEHMIEEKAREILKNQFEDIQRKAIEISENLDYIEIKTN